jgi:DNA polymerase-3 subunit gamma/tau
VQVLGEVPPELRVTPERDARLTQQAATLSQTDAVRLLDLVSAALDATANGAEARIQLELVLIKAAAPEMDPSIEALMSRVERLEAGPRPASALRSVTPAQPAPEPPATRAAQPDHAAPGTALDLDVARASWPAVVDMVRGRNVMLGALLADARPVSVGEREVTIAFPSGAAFLKRKAEQDDYRRVTAEALRTVTGSALALRYELREADDDAAAQPGTPALSGEELVRRFLEEFDAEELLEDEPDEREAT